MEEKCGTCTYLQRHELLNEDICFYATKSGPITTHGVCEKWTSFHVKRNCSTCAYKDNPFGYCLKLKEYADQNKCDWWKDEEEVKIVNKDW